MAMFGDVSDHVAAENVSKAFHQVVPSDLRFATLRLDVIKPCSQATRQMVEFELPGKLNGTFQSVVILHLSVTLQLVLRST